MSLLRRNNPNRRWEELREACVKARQPFDKDMLLNLAFFLDHQYVEWVPEANMLRPIPRRPNERNTPRPVANKIMHFVAQEHAYAVANRPTVDVLPATDDPLDVSIASVSLNYLRWLCDPTVGDFDAENSMAIWWALICGEGYMKWTYNSKEGRPCFYACSPLDIYTDAYATNFNKANYILHSQFMSVEQVFNIYGVEVKPTSISQADPVRSALLREMGQAPLLEGAIVNELWIKPKQRKYPDGKFVVWAGNETLVPEDDFPYEHGQLPFTQVGSIPKPGTPHFTCAVKYMRSQSMELNKYHAQRIMVREKFSNPKWWIPSELELESDPDDSPSQILRGSASSGLKPEIIQPTVFPENTDGQWIAQEMMDTVGLHEVSSAQVPGRVEAAKAIELLKESDTSRLEELGRTIKQSISLGFWQMLMLAKQYVKEEQIVQTYSREGLPEVNRFKSEKIKPGLRVQVTMGTGLARSRAARQDQAMVLWENGVIQDPEIMAELMDIPIGTLAPDKAFDIRLARNENMLITTGHTREGEELKPGTAIKPNSWDAHDIHIREHNTFRKTAEFDGQDPEIKKKFEFHVQMHEAMQLEQAAKQAELTKILQGLAPTPGAEPVDPNQPQPDQQGTPPPQQQTAQQPQST